MKYVILVLTIVLIGVLAYYSYKSIKDIILTIRNKKKEKGGEK